MALVFLDSVLLRSERQDVLSERELCSASLGKTRCAFRKRSVFGMARKDKDCIQKEKCVRHRLERQGLLSEREVFSASLGKIRIAFRNRIMFGIARKDKVCLQKQKYVRLRLERQGVLTETEVFSAWLGKTRFIFRKYSEWLTFTPMFYEREQCNLHFCHSERSRGTAKSSGCAISSEAEKSTLKNQELFIINEILI